MKHIIFFTIVLINTAQAQTTWTVARARDSILSMQRALYVVQAKQAIKDIRDDERNVKIEALTIENKRLKEKTDSLQKKLDSAGVYALAVEDFIIDNNKTAWVRPKYGPNANSFTISRADKKASTLIKFKKAKKTKKKPKK